MTNYPIQFLQKLLRIRAGSGAGEEDAPLHVLSEAEFIARINATGPINPPLKTGR